MISPEAFEIDPVRGFLPGQDPLSSLPAAYQAWEELAAELSEAILQGTIREKIEQLPLIEAPRSQDKRILERAMLLLSFFGHAYVNAPPKLAVQQVPESIAIPWVQVAGTLGRLPVLSHASVVLNNWNRLDPSREMSLDNLATQLQFREGKDESWFYLVTVYIERHGARAIPVLLQCLEHCEKELWEKAAACLVRAKDILAELKTALVRMYEQCEPEVFYHQIRPFLASFNQVQYRGIEPLTRSYHGGSAAQSSLLQFFDAALGMNYDHHPATKDYLLEMRKYMPPRHAAFLQQIESRSTLRANSRKQPVLKMAYEEAVQQLIEFRNEHLKIVSLYIIKPAKNSQGSAKGTGGTNPLLFLKSIRNRNQELK